MLVFAHGIVGRADLPIPEALFGVAAAVGFVLGLFVVIAVVALIWTAAVAGMPRAVR